MSQALTIPIAPPPLCKREEEESVSVHSNPTPFPSGEEHESPLFSESGDRWQGFPAKAEMMKTLITLRFRNLI